MTKYYKVVEVEKELPECGIDFITIHRDGHVHIWHRGYNGKNENDQQYRNLLVHSGITHWLKEITPSDLPPASDDKEIERLGAIALEETNNISVLTINDDEENIFRVGFVLGYKNALNTLFK